MILKEAVRRSLFAETENREGVEGKTVGIVAPLGGTTLRTLRQRSGYIGKFRTKKRAEGESGLERVVERKGIEPSTSALRTRRSPS